MSSAGDGLEAQHKKIRTAFTQQAGQFHTPGLTLTNQDYLRWQLACIAPSPDAEALDVAAGTGIFSRRLAGVVKQVTALDLTAAMLETGRAETARLGITNLRFEQGAAEQLPYPDARFDLVTTRLSLHHLASTGPVLAEMVRVCKPGGQVAVIDLVSPDDASVAVRYNELERLRDPSHTRALTRAELEQEMIVAELRDLVVSARDVTVVFANWAAMTATPAAEALTIESALRAELAGLGAPATGMRPFLEEGVLKFLHQYVVCVGVKAGAV